MNASWYYRAMTMGEALNRGFNLLAVTLVGLAVFLLSLEFLTDADWVLRAADVALFCIGVACVVWYRRRNNRFKNSLVPIYFTAFALGIRVFCSIITYATTGLLFHSIQESRLMFFATLVIVQQYHKTQGLRDSFNVWPANEREAVLRIR